LIKKTSKNKQNLAKAIARKYILRAAAIIRKWKNEKQKV